MDERGKPASPVSWLMRQGLATGFTLIKYSRDESVWLILMRGIYYV